MIPPVPVGTRARSARTPRSMRGCYGYGRTRERVRVPPVPVCCPGSDRLGCPDALPTTYTAPVALRRRADEHLPNEFGPGLIEQSKMEWDRIRGTTRSRYYTGNKRGFSYVELGSRRGILEDIFGNIFTDYMYIVVTIIFQPTTLRAVQHHRYSAASVDTSPKRAQNNSRSEHRRYL